MMTRTEFQTSHRPQDRWSENGVLAFSTGAPTAGIGPVAPTRREAPPAEHHGWRTAVIGATGLALLVVAMGGIAYFRAQETGTTTEAVAEVTIPLSTYASQVPALASRELVVIPESVFASQVPALATVEDVTIPLSTFDSQVPDEAGVMVPLSTYDSQVPEAAR